MQQSLLQKIKSALYAIFTIAACLAAGKLTATYLGGLPASLYGMLLLTCALHFQWVNPDKFTDTVAWVIQHMGVCFVPAGVGIINHYQLIKTHGVALVGIIFCSTFLLLTFVGLVYQRFLTKQELIREKTTKSYKGEAIE